MWATSTQNSLEVLNENARKKVQAFLEKARAEGLDIFVRESKRTKERQYFLFGKWRDAETLKKYGVPTEYAKPSAKKVTRTLNSRHLSWDAVDIVFDKNADPKIQVPSWSGNYSRLIEIWKSVWLRNLAPIELCHFEDDGTPFNSKQLKPMTEDQKKMLIISLMNLCSTMHGHVSDEVLQDLLSDLNDRFRELGFDNRK